MDNASSHPAHAVKTTPTLADWVFIFVVLCILAVVAKLGHDAYLEAMHTENSKKNGEALVAWLTEAGADRFKKDFAHPACAGGTPVTKVANESDAADGDKAAAPAEGTWGACFNHLMTQTEFKDMINPFFDETPKFIAACNPDDDSLMGAMVLEKMVATPPGSAVPVINSQLMDADPIDQKMQLRLSVCDKGSYPIKIAEFEF